MVMVMVDDDHDDDDDDDDDASGKSQTKCVERTGAMKQTSRASLNSDS